ncbi:hypothetical protein D1BOALGB6SA_4101 [Olavius sp. associated proteobacterium Delta 1]|nr:hypothetical protein D1BOALGB6SA_4101 [Olavius sp. associated proteobacterium Delta 1]
MLIREYFATIFLGFNPFLYFERSHEFSRNCFLSISAPAFDYRNNSSQFVANLFL